MTNVPTFRDRFPAPWVVEDTPSGFCVRAACGTALAYIYAPDGFARQALTGHHLTTAEALTLARAIASLAHASQ